MACLEAVHARFLDSRLPEFRVRRTSTSLEKTSNKTPPSSTNDVSQGVNENPEEMSLADLLYRNGNGGRVIDVGGRICLAHEDPVGFAKGLQKLL